MEANIDALTKQLQDMCSMIPSSQENTTNGFQCAMDEQVYSLEDDPNYSCPDYFHQMSKQMMMTLQNGSLRKKPDLRRRKSF